jgi:hypothetical protein
MRASLRHGTQGRQNDGGGKKEQSKRKAPAGPIRQAPLGDARGRQGRRQRYGREPAALKGAATKANATPVGRNPVRRYSDEKNAGWKPAVREKGAARESVRRPSASLRTTATTAEASWPGQLA